MAKRTVKTKTRLYEVDPLTGYKRLAYPAGKCIPLAEFERLTCFNPKARAVDTTPPTPPPVSVLDFADMKRGRLMVEARTRGLTFTNRVTQAELVALLEGAEA